MSVNLPPREACTAARLRKQEEGFLRGEKHLPQPGDQVVEQPTWQPTRTLHPKKKEWKARWVDEQRRDETHQGVSALLVSALFMPTWPVYALVESFIFISSTEDERKEAVFFVETNSMVEALMFDGKLT